MSLLACASDKPDDSNHHKVEAPPSPANSTSTVEHGDNSNNPFMALVDAAASLLQVNNNKNSTAQQPAVAVVDEDDDDDEDQVPSKDATTATKTREEADKGVVIEGIDSSSNETPTAEVAEVQPSSSALGDAAAAPPESASRTAAPLSPPPATSSPTPSSSTTSATRKMTFPEELMDVLEDEQHHDVLAWMPNGISFTIVNHKKFVMTKMPDLFKIRNMSSFVRKLSRWGFQRVHDPTTNNSDVFRHPHFQQGQRSLLSQVKCVAGLSGSHSSPSVPSMMTPATKVNLPAQQGPAGGRPSPARTPPPSHPLQGSRTLTPPPHLAQQRQIRVTASAAPAPHRKASSSSSSKSSGSTNKNLVSQSSALKKALKNRGHLLMTPHVYKNKNSSTTVYFTSASAAAKGAGASSSAPVTPCTPPHGEGGASGAGTGTGASQLSSEPSSTYYTFVAPTTRARDFAASHEMTGMVTDPRYLHQPRLSPPSSSANNNPMMYSAYGMEPSMMMMPMSMHQHQQHHHHHPHQQQQPQPQPQPQHDVAPSVHERLLSVAEDPRLPASLRRRLVSVALDSLRDQLDDASGRSIVTCPLSTSSRSTSSSSYHNSLDTSLGRSMSSLSSSTRSSASTTTTSSPTSGMYPMRPTLSQTRAAMLYPSMQQQAQAQQQAPPPYLPMSVSGVATTTTGPPIPHYRHVMRRTDATGGGPGSVGGGGGGYGGAVPYR